MDVDDDFMGALEFDLSEAQRAVVAEAIDMASRSGTGDAFASLNPLLAIMQAFEESAERVDAPRGSPEERLVRICRWYIKSCSRA